MQRIPVLAARYRALDHQRVTDTTDLGLNLWKLRRKWPPRCAAYRDAAHAASLIEETTQWSDERWQDAWRKSVDRAFLHHADDAVLRPLFEAWCAVIAEK